MDAGMPFSCSTLVSRSGRSGLDFGFSMTQGGWDELSGRGWDKWWKVVSGQESFVSQQQDSRRLTEAEVEKLRNDLQKLLGNKDCGDFIKAMLGSLPNKVLTTNKFEGSLMDNFERVLHGGGFWSGKTWREGLASTDPNIMAMTFHAVKTTPMITSDHSWDQLGVTVDLVHELTHVFTKAPGLGVYGHLQMAQAASTADSALGLNAKTALFLQFPDARKYKTDDPYQKDLSEYYGKTLAYACRKVKL